MTEKDIKEIKKLREEGKSYGDIAKHFLITKSQARYYSILNIEKRNSIETIQKEYVKTVCDLAKRCTNINQILKILGKKGTIEYYKQIRKILEDNNVDTSHFVEGQAVTEYAHPALETKDYLVKGSTIASSKLRNKIIKEGIKEHKCECCGLTEWQGKPIPLQLHHINGDKTDNRIENLQLLCPNCHTFTDNYCGRKLKKDDKKCPVCGSKMSKTAKLCKKCFQDLFKHKKIEDVYKNNEIKVSTKKLNKVINKIKKESKCPTKDELIASFKNLGSFRAVGKKYHVSDNAVRKWCVKYELPVKAKKMREYLRNEYGDLQWSFIHGNSNSLIPYQGFKYPKRCLVGYDGEIEKIYSSDKDIENDGFEPKYVLLVCKGKVKTHKRRNFKFLDTTTD